MAHRFVLLSASFGCGDPTDETLPSAVTVADSDAKHHKPMPKQIARIQSPPAFYAVFYTHNALRKSHAKHMVRQTPPKHNDSVRGQPRAPPSCAHN